MPYPPGTVINIDPTTLQSSQTTMTPGQETVLPDNLNAMQTLPLGYDSSKGLLDQSYLQNLNTQQIGNIFQQIQTFIAANPGLAAVLGLGLLIMAMNTSKGRR